MVSLGTTFMGWMMLITLENSMFKTKQVIGNIHDVFTGDGWENWTRVRVVKREKHQAIEKLGGLNLPRSIVVSLYQHFGVK